MRKKIIISNVNDTSIDDNDKPLDCSFHDCSFHDCELPQLNHAPKNRAKSFSSKPHQKQNGRNHNPFLGNIDLKDLKPVIFLEQLHSTSLIKVENPDNSSDAFVDNIEDEKNDTKGTGNVRRLEKV